MPDIAPVAEETIPVRLGRFRFSFKSCGPKPLAIVTFCQLELPQVSDCGEGTALM